MRREQLQRIALVLRRVRAFPGRLVFDDRRPLRVLEALEAVALELELAGLRLQAAQEFLGVVGRQRLRLRHVLLAVLPEPAEGHRRAQLLLLGRHDVVAALQQLLERDHLRQVGGEIDALDPVDLVAAFGEVVGEPEPLADLVEDPVVGLRFAERLDRLRLEDDDAVVELLLAVMAVAAEARPFRDVGALEIGAGRQDHVGELRLALEPDRLVDHELQLIRLVHPHMAVGVVHRREDRAAVLVEHVHRRMAGRRIARTCRTGARSTCRPSGSLRPCPR